MLFISKTGAWELTIDPTQWIIGANWYKGFNLFFLCFRIGYNLPGSFARSLGSNNHA